MAYPQGGYGGYQQQPGGYGHQVEHPQGTTVLILGVLGIVACQILGPIAWSMGNKALEEIDRDPLRYSNRSNVNLGRILGMVGTAFLALYLVGGILYVVFFIAVFGASSAT